MHCVDALNQIKITWRERFTVGLNQTITHRNVRLRRLRVTLNGDFPVRCVIGLKSTPQKMVGTCFRVFVSSAPADLLLLLVGEFTQLCSPAPPLSEKKNRHISFYISENHQV